jgi:spore coat polysaccharide biosynthesis predicted glycosyltransferase SpsG
VDNQIEHYNFLEKNNLAQCLGILYEESDDYISASALREIIEYEPRRKLIRENINSLVDGFGAKRIVDLILDLNLSKARGLQ